MFGYPSASRLVRCSVFGVMAVLAACVARPSTRAPDAAALRSSAVPALSTAVHPLVPERSIPASGAAPGGLPANWRELASRLATTAWAVGSAAVQTQAGRVDADVAGFDDGDDIEFDDPYDLEDFLEFVEYLDGMFIEITDDADDDFQPGRLPPWPMEPPADPFTHVEGGGDDDPFTVASEVDPDDEWANMTPEERLARMDELLRSDDDDAPAAAPAQPSPPAAPPAPRPGVRIRTPEGEELEQVMLGQPFTLTVDLPAAQARGDAVTVTVATEGNSRVTITIPKAASQPGGDVVRYQVTDPVSIAGRSTTDGFRKEGSITGLTHGKNGESVTFTVPGSDVIGALSVYDDEIQLGIAQGSAALSHVFDVLLAEQRTLREMRSDAEAMKDPQFVREMDHWQSAIDSRLAALRRGRDVIARQTRPMDRLALTEYYLGMLITTDGDGIATVVENIDPRLINDWDVLERLRQRRMDQFISEVALGYTKGIYSMFVNLTMVAPIRQIAIAKNEFGEDASRMDAIKELAKGAVMIVIPAGAAMRYGAGKNIVPGGGIALPRPTGAPTRVLVSRGPGRLSGQTAGGQLPLPSARPPLTGGLTEAQIAMLRSRGMQARSPEARTKSPQEIDAMIAEIDAQVVRARQHGVSEIAILRTLRGTRDVWGLERTRDFIRERLHIETAIANEQRILIAPDQVALLREVASPAQLRRMSVTPIDPAVITSVKTKATLEAQGRPQTWTAEEIRYGRNIAERLKQENPGPRDRVADWLTVDEIVFQNEKGRVTGTAYGGLEPVFNSADLTNIRGIDWSSIRTATPTPAAPPGAPVGLPVGTRAAPLQQPSGSTLIERAPRRDPAQSGTFREPAAPGRPGARQAQSETGTFIDRVPGAEAVLRNPVAQLRRQYGQDSPAARAVDIAIRELGADKVEGVAGSFARGDARVGRWPQGLSYRDVKTLDKLGRTNYTPEQLARMPERVRELYAQREAMGGGKALPSDLDIVLRSEMDAYMLDRVAERIFTETGVLVEFTEATTGSAVRGATPAPPARPAQPAPPAAVPAQVVRSEPVIPSAIVDRAGIARQNGVPQEVINRILRRNLDEDQPYGMALDAIARQLEIAELDANGGRIVVAPYDMQFLRQHATADQLRVVIQVDNPAVLHNAITRARQQLSHQKGEWAQPTWTRAEYDAARQLLAEGDRLLGWKRVETVEFLDGGLEFGGLRQLYDAQDLRILREVDWSGVRVAPQPAGTPASPPIRIPAVPAAPARMIDPARAPESFGGPSGRATAPERPEIVAVSRGGSTGEVLELFVVNAGKPFRLEGTVTLEPVDPATVDSRTAARIDEIRQASLQGKLLTGSSIDGVWTRSFMLDGAMVTQIILSAYCLEFDKLVPGSGMLFRIADRAKQRQDAGLHSIPAAARRLYEEGRLTPDSEPDAYFHSIVQWSVWAREKQFTFESFEKAFLDHTRRNFEDAGHRWNAEAERAVRGLVPNRWNDITTVLRTAGT